MMKRLMAIIMAVTMIFAMCACAAAEPNESDKKDSEVASEVTSEVTETEEKEEVKEEETEVKEDSTEAEEEKDNSIRNEFGLTEKEMAVIYSTIEENLQTEYLEPNNIELEDFLIPDDINCWKYLAKYCMIVMEEPDISEDRLQSLLLGMYPLSSEDQSIMEIISSSFYNSLDELDQTYLITNFQMSELFIDVIKDLIMSNVFADTAETETE